MKPQAPSNLELQILSVLWKKSPLSARAVQDSLPDGKKRAYTSVLSVMQVMEKKRFLSHTSEGNRHLYRPLVKKSSVLTPLLKSWMTNIFGGSPSTAMQHLLDSSEVTPEELSQMRELLTEYETQMKPDHKKGTP